VRGGRSGERFEAAGYAEVIPPAIEAADVFGPEAFRAPWTGAES